MKQNVRELSDVDLIDCYISLSHEKVFYGLPLSEINKGSLLAGFDAADIKFVSKNEQGVWKEEP